MNGTTESPWGRFNSLLNLLLSPSKGLLGGPYQFGDFATETFCQLEEREQSWLTAATFKPPHIRTLKTRGICQLLLRHFNAEPARSGSRPEHLSHRFIEATGALRTTRFWSCFESD